MADNASVASKASSRVADDHGSLGGGQTTEDDQTTASERATSTAKRLDDIMASFEAFDTDMKVGTRQRREKDEFKVFLMKQQMAQLERQLNSEIKRRSEMNKSMMTWCDGQVEQTRGSFRRSISGRRVELMDRVGGLRDRISEMQQRFAVDIEQIPVDIEQRGRELSGRLNSVMDDFEVESKSRLEREAAILKRLADHESSVANQFNTDRTDRETAYVDLRRSLDNHGRTRGKSDEQLKTRLNEDISRLTNSLTMEATLRWREDTELAEAMDGYVKKLQESLRIVNSDAV